MKQLEAFAAKHGGELMRAYAANTAAPLLLLDADGRALTCNPAFLKLTGRTELPAGERLAGLLAGLIGADPSEILFTSCGTESDNMAIIGVARAYNRIPAHQKDKPTPNLKHIITSRVEHHAVLRPCEYLEKNEGFKKC